MTDLPETIKRMTTEGVINDAQASHLLERLAPSPGRLGKFRLAEKLGEGGMGEVWKAWQADLGRWVAIKFVKSDDADAVARFMREAQTAAKLSHPNIVSTFEAGELGGRHYIAMDFIEGDDLKKLRLPARRAAELMRDAALAVHFAHEQGIVHRDLKPQNLMLSKQGRVLVMDFGLARSAPARPTADLPGGTGGAAPSGLSVSGMIVGTPQYMAPEQARGGKIDARADVYALGATLYELVTGQPPFEGETVMDVLRKVDSEDPTPPRRLAPSLNRDVETIVLKCLEKDPARRYASAKDLADDLDRELRGEPISARPISTMGRIVKQAKRNRPAAAAIGVLALLVVGIVMGFVLTSISRARDIADRKARAQAADVETALGMWAELRGLAPKDPEVVANFERMTTTVERRRRLKFLEGQADSVGEEIDAMIKALAVEEQALLTCAGVKDWDPPEAKIPMWAARRNLRRLAQRISMAQDRHWLVTVQAAALSPGEGPYRAKAADVAWRRCQSAERNGDDVGTEFWKSQVEEYHDGKYAKELRGEGRLTISTKPAGARTIAYRYVEKPDTRLLPDDEHPIDLGSTPISKELPADSYLVVIAKDGFRDTRYPVLIKRGEEWKGDVEILKDEEIGENWVYVPGGPFIAGGDREAPGSWPREVRTVGGFLISKFEVTMEEYEAFIRDLLGQGKREEAKTHLPRTTDGRALWEIGDDGAVRYVAGRKDWPMLGVCWDDTVAYCKWRSGRDPDWNYRLPEESQWEKAARGVDGRCFPWGDTFDWAFAKGGYSRDGETQPEPVGSFATDESPYGVRDCAGGAAECCDGWLLEISGLRAQRGGAWPELEPGRYRPAARFGNVPAHAGANQGFRLVRAPKGF